VLQCRFPAQAKPTWSGSNPDGRRRSYDYEDLLKRDKLSLDLFWIKDKGLTDTGSLPPPDVLGVRDRRVRCAVADRVFSAELRNAASADGLSRKPGRYSRHVC
jgi:hypothetical protein